MIRGGVAEVKRSTTSVPRHFRRKGTSSAMGSTESKLMHTKQILESIVLSAPSTAQVLTLLFNLEKSNRKHYSQTILSQQMELKNRGQVSDFLSGRRSMSEIQLKKVCSIFQLPETLSQFLQLLLKSERHCQKPDAQSLANLVTLARKKLLEVEISGLSSDWSTFLSLDIFCAFAKFSNGAIETDFQNLFPSCPLGVIRGCLEGLEKRGHIESRSGRYFLTHNNLAVKFAAESQEFAKKYIQYGFSELSKKVDTQWERRDECLFSHMVLSTSSAKLKESVARMRAFFENECLELEESSGTEIIRVALGVVSLDPSQQNQLPTRTEG